MDPICFTHVGDPMSKGSTVSRVLTRGNGEIVFKNGRPIVVTHDSAGSKGAAHERSIGTAALAARTAAGEPVLRGVAIEVTMRFYMQRPKGHYGTGRNAGVLKDSAPLRPITKPDADKLERRVLDAMTGIMYGDDGQVVDTHPSKHYAGRDEAPRTEVEVRLLDQQTVGTVVADAQLALA